ncbi:MAG: nucleoside deaminase [Bacteroidia bacterium]|nr:nucleoside deaminase [Bacteroidia bacterium]
MKDDKSLLLHAVKLAEEGIAKGGGPFGAVIALEGKILAEAVNKVVINSDPTAHAEVLAIREAAAALKSHDLKNCIIYCSCEPCPMCLGAIYWAGIRKVIYACDRHDAEIAGFSDKFIYDEIILDPSERQVKFVRIENAGGGNVFNLWKKYEDRIPY